MSNRKWNISMIVLFIIFAWLLLNFMFSAQRIYSLVKAFNSSANMEVYPPHVVLIAQELDNPFWRSIEQGAVQASHNYGMNIEYMGPFRINPAEQMKLLEKTITKKVDAIFVQGLNDPLYRKLIDQAFVQGIPVITIDSDEPESRRLSYVGTDHVAAGKRMGELVVQK
ncbi:D-ribose-binding periplasmic protein precursor [compost metagenome]